jgi:hypothetical protein
MLDFEMTHEYNLQNLVHFYIFTSQLKKKYVFL